MYIVIGEQKSRLILTVLFYIVLSILNISSFLMSLFPSIKTALVTQYIIFIIAYASALVVIRDRSYVLSFGRADDRGFVIAVKTLAWMLTVVNLFGVLYVSDGVGQLDWIELVRYSVILSISIIFSQEIRQLLFQFGRASKG